MKKKLSRKKCSIVMKLSRRTVESFHHSTITNIDSIRHASSRIKPSATFAVEVDRFHSSTAIRTFERIRIEAVNQRLAPFEILQCLLFLTGSDLCFKSMAFQRSSTGAFRGIKAIIAHHFKILVRNMDNECLDKVTSGKS